MHLGYEPGPLLAEADAVLVLECDVPWISSLQGPRTDAKIIHLGVDPLFADYPARGFRTDLAITANPETALPVLADALADRVDAESVAARRSRLAQARDQLHRTWGAELEGNAHGRPIHPAWLTHCLDRARGDDSIIVNEVGLLPQYLTLNRPGSYFAPSPAGGLGWGLGAALGAKLAAPDREIIAAVGDGSYMFGNPTPAHYMSRAHDLPILFVVANNSGWARSAPRPGRCIPTAPPSNATGFRSPHSSHRRITSVSSKPAAAMANGSRTRPRSQRRSIAPAASFAKSVVRRCSM